MILASISLPLFQPGVQFQLTGGSFFNIDIGFLPLLALVLATPKIEIKKAFLILLSGLAIFLLIDLVIIWLGIPLKTSGSPLDNTTATYTVYRTIILILPLVIWLTSTHNQLKEIFLPKEKLPESARVCPICKKEKTGLVDHIKTVHGHKALKKPRVQRYLKKNSLI